ncbi:metal-dependent hydrolase [Haloprofundus marisrubri]|uniref:Metal-dependent hydrolase n=1 Tax=Haloprofundus marisrubri TaxID=1514971 RepID=A0A0W1R3G1_9EURY|nr:hypothetical protein [Haloprofundus marisrubri]KTG07722.1 metal-dependent hydrolase [Haloprofundus marisrubri]
MLFATHLLAAAVLARVRRLPVFAVVLGAALPDLIDKPLATSGVVEMFHTVGHTALLFPLALAVALTGRHGVAIAVGWALHLFMDALHIVINGRPTDALFLFWPLVVPPTPLAIPPGEFFWYYLWSPSFFLEVAIWTVVGVTTAKHLHATWADH